MKLKKRKIAVIGGLVVLGFVVGLAGLFLAVLPQRSKAHDLDSQIAALQAQLVSMPATRHQPAVRAADLFALARAMPDKTDMPSIVLDLARAATTSRVTLNSITPSAPVPQPDGSLAVPLNVSVTGSWAHVGAFLRTLRLEVRTTKKDQKLLVAGRLFVADSVQLTALPTGSIQATLALDAFSYGVIPAATTSTDTTATTTTSSSSGSVQAAGATGSAG